MIYNEIPSVRVYAHKIHSFFSFFCFSLQNKKKDFFVRYWVFLSLFCSTCILYWFFNVRTLIFTNEKCFRSYILSNVCFIQNENFSLLFQKQKIRNGSIAWHIFHGVIKQQKNYIFFAHNKKNFSFFVSFSNINMSLKIDITLDLYRFCVSQNV